MMDITMEPQRAPHIPVAALGWSLGVFLAVTYTVCVLFDLAFPTVAMDKTWLPLLPWVSVSSLPGFLLGLLETVLYGWFVALVFAPLFNLFAKRAA